MQAKGDNEIFVDRHNAIGIEQIGANNNATLPLMERINNYIIQYDGNNDAVDATGIDNGIKLCQGYCVCIRSYTNHDYTYDTGKVVVTQSI